MRDAPRWVVPHPTRSERPAVRIHRREADVPGQVVADQQRWRMAPTLSVACAPPAEQDRHGVRQSIGDCQGCAAAVGPEHLYEIRHDHSPSGLDGFEGPLMWFCQLKKTGPPSENDRKESPRRGENP